MSAMRADARTSVWLPACMGGWCRIRDACPRYHANSVVEPAERLCDAGKDGCLSGYPVIVRRPVGSWERPMVPSMLRPADPFDSLESK